MQSAKMYSWVAAMAVTLVTSISYGSIQVPSLVEHKGQLVDNDGGYDSCMACHDGYTAKAVEYRIPGAFAYHSLGKSPLGSHPVEIEYPMGNMDYRSSDMVQMAGLRFSPDGKMSCITCHDLRLEKRPYYLPVTMVGSELCFSCHVK